MVIKKDLIKKLQKEPEKYWKVRLFEEKGFVRKQCKSCGKFFWTMNPETELCGDSPCVRYSFINNSPCRKKLDYIQTWKTIERFFVRNGHESIQSYPSVCRWFPGLYFTVASIVAFQRKVGRETVFEMPANPLIIPQSCMRFNDISNTGRTGKHYTNFVMIGQHSIYNSKRGEGYWKDRCAELDYELLTKIFSIKPEEITWIEDAWLGPAAFGYSLEYFARGLELGNAVFTEFLGTLDNYRVMEDKVIDMGAGLERFAWITQGTPTSYDATFGPVIKKLKKRVDYDRDLFLKYAEIAGGMNIDEVKDMKNAKERIAKALGIGFQELERHILPLEAVYAIADHTKSLLFAISDGTMPSAVGGGYNLRLVLRRAFEFLKDFNLDIDLARIAEEHARYLKPLFPNLKNGLQNFSDIIETENIRFEETRNKGRRIVEKILEKGEKLSDEKLILLYESNGISPELVQQIAREKNTGVEVPEDFYMKISEKHMTEKPEEEEHVDVSGIKPTELLYKKDQNMKKFRARVLKIVDKDKVVLDRTAFYPESGGQKNDMGMLGDSRVYNVQKFGDVVVHYVEKPRFRENKKIEGEIDWERREQLAKHHTSIHIINLAARHVLGNHVFQAGSGKTQDKAHLDITHYKPINQDELERIEKKANEIVKKAIPIKIEMLPREEAERKYGMGIYQGGAVPDKTIRIVSVGNLDHEACGGTHLSNTGEAGRIVILSAERIQDGVDRITIKAGKTAEVYCEENIKKAMEMLGLIKKDLHFIRPSKTLIRNIKKPTGSVKELQACARFFSVQPEQIKKTIEKFCREIIKNCDRLAVLRRQLKLPEKTIRDYLKKKEVKSLLDVCECVFNTWKEQGKELEKLRRDIGKLRAEILIKKAKDNEVFDVFEGDTKQLIEIANEVLKTNPKLTVILANQSGNIIGMSRTKDMGKTIKDICQKAGGSGGGSKELAQGRAELSKLLKVIGNA
jgi:alanyl-tRNA synthetase